MTVPRQVELMDLGSVTSMHSDEGTLSLRALVKQSQKYIHFLQRLHAAGVTFRNPTAKSANRYLRFWLPLVGAEQSKHHSRSRRRDALAHIMPPPDIAWLWHCHRLAPAMYEDYTVRRFGLVLDPTDPFDFQTPNERGDDCGPTRKVWKRMFPEEPFFLPEEDNRLRRKGTPDRKHIRGAFLADRFDLYAAVTRQQTFLWNVSAPCYSDVQFLYKAAENYERFVRLATDTKYPIIPTMPIDLMWHTHILSSISVYNSECMKMRGSKLHHDDSLGDSSDSSGSGVDAKAWKETCRKWKEAYKSDYATEQADGVQRTDPPSDFYTSNWAKNIIWKRSSIAMKIERRAKMADEKKESPPVVEVKKEKKDKKEKKEKKYRSVFAPPPLPGTPSSPTSVVEKLEEELGEDDLPPGDSPWLNASEAEQTFVPYPEGPCEQLQGFAFGMGESGRGYYSLETREAHLLLYQRLEKKEQALRETLSWWDNAMLLLCCCNTYEWCHNKKQGWQDQLLETREMMSYEWLRYKSAGPYAALPKFDEIADVTEMVYVPMPVAPRTALSKSSREELEAYQQSVCRAAGCGGTSHGAWKMIGDGGNAQNPTDHDVMTGAEAYHEAVHTVLHTAPIVAKELGLDFENPLLERHRSRGSWRDGSFEYENASRSTCGTAGDSYGKSSDESSTGGSEGEGIFLSGDDGDIGESFEGSQTIAASSTWRKNRKSKRGKT